MVISATIHRPITGEKWSFASLNDGPTLVGDGESIYFEVPSDHRVEVDDVACPEITVGARKTFVVTLGVQTSLGARRVSIHRQREVQSIDVITKSSALAIKRLLPAVPQVEKWLPRLRGGFWYLDLNRTPRRVVDPTRVLAFVKDSMSKISRHLKNIELEPASRRTSKVQVRPFGFPIDVAATRSLLISQPALLLRTHDGPIQINGLRYEPQLVACRIPVSDLLAIENRRLVAFLKSLDLDCRSAIKNAHWLDELSKKNAIEKTIDLRRITHRSFLASVPQCEMPKIADPAIGLEVTHSGYRSLRQLRIEYQSLAGYGFNDKQYRKHIASADKVYQAWCCHLIAHALGLVPMGDALRNHSGPAFYSDDWELFYDSAQAVTSWRSETVRPDYFRPDIFLRRKKSASRVILLDAKYVSDDCSEVPGDRLKEVQAYLNGFGIRNAGVMFPGKSSSSKLHLREISGRGHKLLEISVTPDSIQDDVDLELLRSAVLGLECECGETFLASSSTGKKK